MAPTYLMLLWHQHQPYYKDLIEDRYTMPWVRLHALKDYYGMVAELRDFPSVHVTFNLVPSLLAQLQDYAQGRANEEAFEVAFKPAAALSLPEREQLLHYAFQVNRENLLYRYPRFRMLFEKANPGELGTRLAAAFSEAELRDLQVLSQLAWFEETWLTSDAEVSRLVRKGKGFNETDKIILRKKEQELFQAVLQEHRAALERGQIEISTSPFYHPILPLLCDTDVALESHPGVRLPRGRFRHPEDAVSQLRAARELHRQVFGSEPAGLWPSEGSVSDEALALAAGLGFQWAATDEGVLGRSLGIGFARQSDGSLWGGHELYRPHRLETPNGPISLFFRDHEISDLIGFVYSGMPPESSAGSLMDRVRRAGRSMGDGPAVVSIILDGENAWEFYRENGRPFFRALYGMLARDSEVRAVTASEALQKVEPGRLSHVVPGSWINANFDVWIGAEEDNHAWDLLSNARDFFQQESAKPGHDPDQVRLAEQELCVAEGSDWCWWYGPEHSTANDEEFDWLYRKHLSNVYRLLGAPAPDELAIPVKRPRGTAHNVEPADEVKAVIDGLVTNYFEWLGAGVYSPAATSGSMHGPTPALDSVHYGRSDSVFYLRLDLNRLFLQSHSEFSIRVTLEAASTLRVHAHIRRGELRETELWTNDVPVPRESLGDSFEIALGRILELRAGYDLFGLAADKYMRAQVSVWEQAIPVQVIPQEGWLSISANRDSEYW
ncbi:MAG TPA: glycoside hydrolase family 57 protein [Terriglobia bacterium]|nr:glycoside hydrolase family 57 protein [Terriglobia bacterium]